ncbi:PAP2 family protein [Natronococcus pandeyae]|uniref:PAP2 family protein n=2 Tax=Natronococcus pandeyae TaxID=2055836 RepID=A0A8J8TT83_9EURY|nr:PAP2 family protein [Natronococcus pandeyae]
MGWTALDDALFDESTNQGLREALPDVAIAAFELLTHLGDGAALIVFATLLYWFGTESRRRKRALVIAIGLGALAISAGMKGIFLRPRPELADGYGGYSFPSAHAMGAAAFYGALAVVSNIGTRVQRYVVAGVVIFLVALSRVVIGVHFVGDVLAGVVIGLAFVALILRTDDPEPGSVFALSGVLAFGAYLLGSREFTTLTIGAALGATGSWMYVRNQPADPRGAALLVLAAICLPVLIALRFVFGAVPGHWVLEIVGYAAATGAIIAAPLVAERLNDWPPVVWLQRRLPFSGRVLDPDQVTSR